MADDSPTGRARALPEPQRKVALDLLTKDPADWECGREFAALTAQQRRHVYEAVLPEWADVLELACAQSGHVPLLLFSVSHVPRTRLPRHPELATIKFWNSLRAFIQQAPGDPVMTAQRVASCEDGTRAHLSDTVGAFVGIACDVPGKPGDRVFEALRRAARRERPDSSSLGESCVAALITAQRAEAWDLLLELDKSGAFGWTMPVERYYFGGRLSVAGRLMETFLERYNAWPDTLASGKSQINVKVALERLARLLKWLNEPAARKQCYDQGSPAEVMESLQMEMTIDLSEAAEIAGKLRQSADPARRTQGVYATMEINNGGFPTHFEAELYEDPDQRVRLCCLRADEYAKVNTGDQAAHFQRLQRLLATLEGSVTHTIPGVPGSNPVDGDYVLLVMASHAEPLDPMVPYLDQMKAPFTRRQFGRVIGKRAAVRPLTPLETAMLGRLASDRSGDVKTLSLEIMTRIGLDPAQAKVAWKNLGLAPAPKTTRKPPLGKWAALLARRAKAAEASSASGPPASEATVAGLEQKLGVTLPPQLRELLLEADGMRDTSDSPRDITGVEGIADMTRLVRDQAVIYKQPPNVDGAVFFADLDNGDYIGICGKNLGKMKTGTVILFDHETGTLEIVAKDLEKWIKSPD
jgi:hypothetical protein